MSLEEKRIAFMDLEGYPEGSWQFLQEGEIFVKVGTITVFKDLQIVDEYKFIMKYKNKAFEKVYCAPFASQLWKNNKDGEILETSESLTGVKFDQEEIDGWSTEENILFVREKCRKLLTTCERVFAKWISFEDSFINSAVIVNGTKVLNSGKKILIEDVVDEFPQCPRFDTFGCSFGFSERSPGLPTHNPSLENRAFYSLLIFKCLNFQLYF